MVTQRDSQLLVFYDFFLFIYFDGQFRPFSFFHSNTYSGAEISIISLRFGGLEITLVRFSPLFTRLRFRFVKISRSLVAYGGPSHYI